MSKFPHEGKVKTRLIPSLGEQGACDLHRMMAEHTYEKVMAYTNLTDNTSYTLHIAGASLDETNQWLGDGNFSLQAEGDLGHKMLTAAQESFQTGASKVLIIGTDCPSITHQHLSEAFSALEQHDIVYIPANDGGYVLIGLSAAHEIVFQEIDWGSENVLEQSLKQAERKHLSVRLLQSLSDIDTPDDIELAYKELGIH